jgi:hypothetical protein
LVQIAVAAQLPLLAAHVVDVSARHAVSCAGVIAVS